MTENSTMKLWILRPVSGLEKHDDPWEPWYDTVQGFVIRAETELKARSIAHSSAGEENDRASAPWLDGKYSTCVELTPDGAVAMLMRDFARS